MGNDGSGKTTFLARAHQRLTDAGVVAEVRHYYKSWVRRLLRQTVERVTGVSRRKKEESLVGISWSHVADGDQPLRLRSGLSAAPFFFFLWIYLALMALEARLRDCATRGALLYDRSFVDDLVSTIEMFRLTTPVRLVRWSARVFPVRRLYYLNAGHEVEYARITELDLSADLHRRKGLRYQELVEIVESAGVPVRRLHTISRVPTGGHRS